MTRNIISIFDVILGKCSQGLYIALKGKRPKGKKDALVKKIGYLVLSDWLLLQGKIYCNEREISL